MPATPDAKETIIATADLPPAVTGAEIIIGGRRIVFAPRRTVNGFADLVVPAPREG